MIARILFTQTQITHYIINCTFNQRTTNVKMNLLKKQCYVLTVNEDDLKVLELFLSFLQTPSDSYETLKIN